MTSVMLSAGAQSTATLAGVGDSFSNTVSTGPLLLALGACVLAGLVSFASPCVVPLVPGYLSYLAGLVGAEAPAMNDTTRATPNVAPSWRIVWLTAEPRA